MLSPRSMLREADTHDGGNRSAARSFGTEFIRMTPGLGISFKLSYFPVGCFVSLIASSVIS